MCRHDNADRAIHARKLFDDRDVLHIPHARAAVLRWEHRSHQPQLADFFNRVQRKLSRLVPLHDVGADLPLGKLAYGLLQLQLLFIQ